MVLSVRLFLSKLRNEFDLRVLGLFRVVSLRFDTLVCDIFTYLLHLGLAEKIFVCYQELVKS